MARESVLADSAGDHEVARVCLWQGLAAGDCDPQLLQDLHGRAAFQQGPTPGKSPPAPTGTVWARIRGGRERCARPRQMADQVRTRVPVVAKRTAATPRLMEAIAERRRRGPCEFALLIPDATDRKRADWTLENALPLLRMAAGWPVEGIVGHSGDPFASVAAAVSDGASTRSSSPRSRRRPLSDSVAIS